MCGGLDGRQETVERSQRAHPQVLIAAAVAEGILKVAALLDIRRRPASQIRGPKWMWAVVVAVVGSAGVVPVSYFAFRAAAASITQSADPSVVAACP